MSKRLPVDGCIVTLRPFTHPYPDKLLSATIALMYACQRRGQKPHGWLFQSNWTMVRGGVGERQHGDIHTTWPDASLDRPVGATNQTVSVCMGSRDELTYLLENQWLYEPTPRHLRRPC